MLRLDHRTKKARIDNKVVGSLKTEHTYLNLFPVQLRKVKALHQERKSLLSTPFAV